MDIIKTYDIPYPVQQVYAAWISSDTVITPATAMDIDPVPGGHYRLIMELPEFSGRNEGKFLLVEAEKRLVYTWEWNGDGEVTEIDVSFSETSSGTRVEIVHSGFRDQASMENHESGWDSYVEGFIKFLGR